MTRNDDGGKSAGGDGPPLKPKPAARRRRDGYDKEETLQIEAASFFDCALPKPGSFWYHVPNGSWKTPRERVNFQRMGLKPGVPDNEIIFGGRSHYIELKARYGVLSDIQKDVITELEAAGSPVAVCRTLEEIVAALAAWGIPLRSSLDSFRSRKTAPVRMSAAEFRSAMAAGNLVGRR